MKKTTLLMAMLFLAATSFAQTAPPKPSVVKAVVTVVPQAGPLISIWNGFWAVITAMGGQITEKPYFWINK